MTDRSVKTGYDGDATFVGTAKIPLSRVLKSRIIFNYKNNNGFESVDRELVEPISMVKIMKNVKILIELNSKGLCKERCFSVGGASGINAANDETTRSVFFYNPVYGMFRDFGQGVSLSIPKWGLDRPSIFYMYIGKKGEVVDIFPRVKLLKRSELRIGSGDEGGVFHIESTGYFEKNGGSGKVEGNLGFLKNPDRILECIRRLESSEMQWKISQDLSSEGVSIVDYCKNIPPYVHIAVVDGRRGSKKFDLVFRSIESRRYGRVLYLSRLDSFLNFKVAVNEFTWAGDFGFSAGGEGLAKGYVKGVDIENRRIGRVLIGSNCEGGSSISFCSANERGVPCTTNIRQGGYKRVAYFAPDQRLSGWETRDGVYENWDYWPVVISSSTSVVFNDSCANDSHTDRWSAFGSRHSGRSVFLSSASEGSTNAKEMCRVFRALGISNAIRLDGSSAAAMTINGELVNPLTGIHGAIYGEARYIPYAFGFGEEGLIGR